MSKHSTSFLSTGSIHDTTLGKHKIASDFFVFSIINVNSIKNIYKNLSVSFAKIFNKIGRN